MKLLPEKVGGENISIFLIQLSQAPQLLHPLQVRREPHVAQSNYAIFPRQRQLGNRSITHQYHFTRSPYMDPSSPESHWPCLTTLADLLSAHLPPATFWPTRQ